MDGSSELSGRGALFTAPSRFGPRSAKEIPAFAPNGRRTAREYGVFLAGRLPGRLRERSGGQAGGCRRRVP